jgi:hypothetical protein
MKEFAHYLTNMEKDLNSRVKKMRNKETSRSAVFVTTGIHEAVQYLEIVRKVIEKTQKALQKKAQTSIDQEDVPPSTLT